MLPSAVPLSALNRARAIASACEPEDETWPRIPDEQLRLLIAGALSPDRDPSQQYTAEELEASLRCFLHEGGVLGSDLGGSKLVFLDTPFGQLPLQQVAVGFSARSLIVLKLTGGFDVPAVP